MINKPKKSLGQNFLNDQNIIKKIIDIGDISENDNILEIGPGTGNLTNEIIKKKPRKILVIEKDKNLSSNLFNRFKDKIEIFNEDILKFDSKKLPKEKLIIFGNLPYNISSQILVKWIISDKLFNSSFKLIFMFQKEVADRIISRTNDKNFGRLSVISNWRFNITKHFDISKSCFFPIPKVESTLLSFEPKKKFIKFDNSKNLEFITRVFFSNKRKMINKAYKNVFKDNKDIAKSLNLNLNERPAKLTCEDYYNLTKSFEKLKN